MPTDEYEVYHQKKGSTKIRERGRGREGESEREFE